MDQRFEAFVDLGNGSGPYSILNALCGVEVMGQAVQIGFRFAR